MYNSPIIGRFSLIPIFKSRAKSNCWARIGLVNFRLKTTTIKTRGIY